MILALAALAAWFVMARYAGTPTGRVLRRWLVDEPLHRCGRISRGHVILACLFAVAVVGLVWLVGDEASRLLAMAAPEVIGWASSFEVATVVDAAFVAVTAAGLFRVGRAAGHVRAILSRRPRLRRARHAPDEEHGASLPLPRRHRVRRERPLRPVARRRSPNWSGAAVRRR